MRTLWPDKIKEALESGREYFINLEFKKSLLDFMRFCLKDDKRGVKLPFLPSIQKEETGLDLETIKRLDELMTNDEKRVFLKNIRNHECIDYNIFFLLLNSSPKAIKYVVDLIKWSIDHDLGDEEPIITSLDVFEEIPNLWSYILANFDFTMITYDRVVHQLKRSILIYQPDLLEPMTKRALEDIEFMPESEHEVLKNAKGQVPVERLSDEEVTLSSLNLRDKQLEDNKDEFFKQVEEKERADRLYKKLKILGLGIAINLTCFTICTALGLPMSGLISKAVKSALNDKE